MKNVLFLGLSCLAVALSAAGIPVTIERVSSRWPWEAKIDIDFTVTCSEQETADVSFAFANGATPLAFPLSAFSGSLEALSSGRHRVTLDPEAAGYTNQVWRNFTVTAATAHTTPLYLIVDLTKEKGEAGQISYLSAADIKSGNYGTYIENPVPGVESLIWTGVTNDIAYKTTKLVLRRVPAGTFQMGVRDGADIYKTPTNEVTLTSSFYIGVFETTQAQWEQVMGTNPSYFTKNGAMRPVEGLNYSQVRGSTAAANWPHDGYGKAANGSFLQKMCARTGLVFDLPTYAQWQFASAYTLTGFWFNNKTKPDTSTHWQTGPEADAVARYSNNSKFETILVNATRADCAVYDTDTGTALVGSYAPSVLGLYDMHGNVWEFLLDWSGGGYPPKMTDPTGPASGTTRKWCGGSFRFDARRMAIGTLGGYSAVVDFKDTLHIYLRESGFRAIVMPK